MRQDTPFTLCTDPRCKLGHRPPAVAPAPAGLAAEARDLARALAAPAAELLQVVGVALGEALRRLRAALRRAALRGR